MKHSAPPVGVLRVSWDLLQDEAIATAGTATVAGSDVHEYFLQRRLGRGGYPSPG